MVLRLPSRAFVLVALVALPHALAAPPAADGRAHVPYLVGFHDLPAEAREGSYAGEAVERVDAALRFAVVSPRDPRAFEARAAGDPNVRYLKLDDPDAYAATFAPSDPLAPEQYALPLVGALGAWDATLGSTAVTLAVVDSGVAGAHEDLAGRLLVGRDLVNGDNDPQDDCGHGTHVTGTAAASTDNGKGVAGIAQATILPVKALNSYCRGSWSQVASAIRFAADAGASVISLSVSCGVSCTDTATSDAIEYAWAKGALLVVAAGNEGPCDACIGFPASHPRSLAVGCSDAANALCTFSSRGPGMILAPGKDVLSTTRDGGYGLMSGTSMSTPHVSGAAALALAREPTLTNAQLRALLVSSAKDLGPVGPDGAYGVGLLDVAALLAASTSAAPAPPEPLRVVLTPSEANATIAPGGSVTYRLTLTNLGPAKDTFSISKTATPSGWRASLSATSLTIPPGGAATVDLTVKALKQAPRGSTLQLGVTATSRSDPTASDAALTRTQVR